MTREATSPPASTLYRGGVVHAPAEPLATSMVVAGDQIAWIGNDEAAAGLADGVDQVIDLAGALVTPTFVDAHAHTSATGMGLRSTELTDVRSLHEALARIEAAARKRAGRPIYAPNWDEQDWPERRPPTAQELDRATYGGVAYSPRVDGHSAVISSALAAASGARNHPGWNDSGLLTREAHHIARDAFYAGITRAERRADIAAGLSAAAVAGIGLVHEIGGPTLSSEADFADVLAAGDRGDGPQVVGYWAELVGDEESARALAGRLGARGLAGDLNIDGSIGSRTASLREPYTDGPGSPDTDRCGNAYLTVEQVCDHVAACSLAGVQAGFHVIGDAGADTVIAGMQAAAARVGRARVVAARHRLEHLEMVDAAGIKALVELGVTASVQPAFDASWGGPEGMYVVRLGRQRAAGMNPFAVMLEAGLPLAFGSDTPVTPFAPWEAIRAAVFHHDPSQRISAHSAFLAHTRGGWRAAGIDDRGYLDPGQPASFAIWSLGSDSPKGPAALPDLSPGVTLPTTLRTVIHGRTVFDREGALP
ncbi:MAG: amidohydrolase family protein [Dermatophilaceae bacterium]